MAAAERITFAGFQERFKTEEQCREYLFQQRFPNGFVCPSCGAKEYYPILDLLTWRDRHGRRSKNNTFHAVAGQLMIQRISQTASFITAYKTDVLTALLPDPVNIL